MNSKEIPEWLTDPSILLTTVKRKDAADTVKECGVKKEDIVFLVPLFIEENSENPDDLFFLAYNTIT